MLTACEARKKQFFIIENWKSYNSTLLYIFLVSLICIDLNNNKVIETGFEGSKECNIIDVVIRLDILLMFFKSVWLYFEDLFFDRYIPIWLLSRPGICGLGGFIVVALIVLGAKCTLNFRFERLGSRITFHDCILGLIASDGYRRKRERVFYFLDFVPLPCELVFLNFGPIRQ